MPTCREITELATDHREGALPLRRRLGVELHLARCADCRVYLDQMEETIRAVGLALRDWLPSDAARLIAARPAVR